MEQRKFLFDKEAFRHCEELLAMPLKELPRGRCEIPAGPRFQVDRAARLDNPDWQILQKLKDDGNFLRVPDLRGCAAWRGPSMSDSGPRSQRDHRRRDPDRKDDVRPVAPPGRTPDAHGHPGGHRHGAIAIGPLEEMLEQPGCPNLYWG